MISTLVITRPGVGKSGALQNDGRTIGNDEYHTLVLKYIFNIFRIRNELEFRIE